jgi:hypothetical protein
MRHGTDRLAVAGSEGAVMVTPFVIEIARLSAHQRVQRPVTRPLPASGAEGRLVNQSASRVVLR